LAVARNVSFKIIRQKLAAMDHNPQRGMIRKADARRPRVAFIDRLQLRWAVGRRIDGLWIGTFFRSKAEEDSCLQRVQQALDLIKLHDPVRYCGLLRDLERIWITLVGGGLAEFDQALAACKLDERFVLDESTSAEMIAGAIVHEATHARLARYGIGYEEEIRGRVEAVCMRREIAFADKLPDGQALREQAERSLSLCDDNAYWTGAAFTERHTAEASKALRYLGVPDLVVRLFVGTLTCKIAARRFLRGLSSRASTLRGSASR
jgi:hypothetical protein